MKKFIMLLSFLLPLSACADRWSATGADGTPYEVAEPQCRAQARASARRQMPFPFEYRHGPAGFPGDSIHDIERMETALCLQNRGFTLSRE